METELDRVGGHRAWRARARDRERSWPSPAWWGGLRRWLAHCGAKLEHLRIKVPVSLHAPGDDAANLDSFSFVDVPLEHADPVERLCAIARETAERKRAHDAETIDEFFHDLSHLLQLARSSSPSTGR